MRFPPGSTVVRPGEHGTHPSPTCPAVRVGDVVRFAGAVGLDADRRVVPGGVAGQARQALATVGGVLAGLGGSLEDVVHVRAYLVDMADLPALSEVLDATFGRPWPPTTVVAVAALATPDLRVEIEPEAVLPPADEPPGVREPRGG